MGIAAFARFVFLVLAALFALLGLILSMAALFTPSWQVVVLSEFSSRHEHGLLMDCMEVFRNEEGVLRKGNKRCTFKWDGSADHTHAFDAGHSHGESKQHAFHAWQVQVIGLITAAILCGFVAVCFALCASCSKICGIVFCIFTLFAAATSLVSVGIFFVHSHRIDNRFVTGVSKTYEQRKGYSFWLELGATLAFVISFMLGILATIFLFIHDRMRTRPHKTWPKNNTSV